MIPDGRAVGAPEIRELENSTGPNLELRVQTGDRSLVDANVGFGAATEREDAAFGQGQRGPGPKRFERTCDTFAVASYNEL